MFRILRILSYFLPVALMIPLALTTEPIGKFFSGEIRIPNNIWLITTIGWVFTLTVYAMMFTYVQYNDSDYKPILYINGAIVFITIVALTRVMNVILAGFMVPIYYFAVRNTYIKIRAIFGF